jgi:uncharacterized protein (DUF433 family)
MALAKVKRKSPAALPPLVSEDVNGVIQHYHPLGKYVVIQPQVCGGRPTIKYTRIDARAITGALRRGDSAELIAEIYRIPLAAVEEAVQLAEVYDYERSYA